MNKEWLKRMVAQLGVQSLFVAADEAVRTVVRQKIKVPFSSDKNETNRK